MKYIIKSFNSSGDPFDSKAGKLQSYWLELEGVEGGVLWSKKQADGPPELGEVHGELIAQLSSKGNKYYKFKKGMPDTSSESAEQAFVPEQVSTTPQGKTELREALERLEKKLDRVIDLLELKKDLGDEDVPF